MSAEDHNPADPPPENGDAGSGGRTRMRFTAEEAREKAQQARQKAEFILSRAYGLLRDPKQEWEQIRAEETNIPSILLGYVAPLAAIPPLCGLIGTYVFGASINGVIIRPPLNDAIVSAGVSFVASVAMVYLIGVLINTVADNFDADKDELAAQKVAAYSMTPTFLSGVFSLWPPIWWLSLIAIGTSAFLFYRGLPPLMKAPEDRALGYAATVAIAGIVALVIVLAVSSCMTGAGRL